MCIISPLWPLLVCSGTRQGFLSRRYKTLDGLVAAYGQTNESPQGFIACLTDQTKP